MSSGKAPAFVSLASCGTQAQQKSLVAVPVEAAPLATSGWAVTWVRGSYFSCHALVRCRERTGSSFLQVMVINIFFSKLENECLLLTEDLKYIEECKKRRLINPPLRDN